MRPTVALLAAAAFVLAGDESPSAFDFKSDPEVKRAIDTEELIEGTRAEDPKDAIPAVWKPKAVRAKDARWLGAKDRVLGVVVGKEARAYPLFLLETHEMVNDILGGKPIAPNY